MANSTICMFKILLICLFTWGWGRQNSFRVLSSCHVDPRMELRPLGLSHQAPLLLSHFDGPYFINM